jgi:hypothetical protein
MINALPEINFAKLLTVNASANQQGGRPVMEKSWVGGASCKKLSENARREIEGLSRL